MSETPPPREPKDETDLLRHLPLTLMTRRARPRITWTDAKGGHECAIDSKVLVGSSVHVHAVIQDRSVSRLHAELEVREDGVWVRDLGSTNGTWINGVFVHSARIAEGDTISFGGIAARVDYAASTENVALWPTDHFGDVFGRSEVMRELFFRMSKCIDGDAPILISGETGTGKELVARALHEASPRAKEPFVIVDSVGLEEDWIERELFGDSTTAGALESAHGGTVFFDEIGELPLALQPKLLRALETGVVRRRGEMTPRPIHVRVISATNHDLKSMVSGRVFREGLYFRLAVLPLDLPPLRARGTDGLWLLERWLADIDLNLDEPTRRVIVQHPWPGNVRELKNFAERVRSIGLASAKITLEGGEVPTPTSHPAAIAPALASTGLPLPPIDRPFKAVREEWVDHVEREYIGALLKLHGRNVGSIADAAGLDRSYVHRLMRKHSM